MTLLISYLVKSIVRILFLSLSIVFPHLSKLLKVVSSLFAKTKSIVLAPSHFRHIEAESLME